MSMLMLLLTLDSMDGDGLMLNSKPVVTSLALGKKMLSLLLIQVLLMIMLVLHLLLLMETKFNGRF